MRNDETPEFVEFWEGPQKEDGSRDRSLGWISIQRRNDGRGEARTTFNKHLKAGVDGQDIADGSKWYIMNLKADEKPYVPLAATWMNRCCYEDRCDQWRDYQDRIKSTPKPAENVVPMTTRKTPFLAAWERGDFKKTGE